MFSILEIYNTISRVFFFYISTYFLKANYIIYSQNSHYDFTRNFKIQPKSILFTILKFTLRFQEVFFKLNSKSNCFLSSKFTLWFDNFFTMQQYVNSTLKQIDLILNDSFSSLASTGLSEGLKIWGCQYYLVGIICPPWLR